MARNKKNKPIGESNSERIGIRCDKQSLNLWNKAVKKRNMSKWFRDSLYRDFGHLITIQEMISAEKYKLSAIGIDKQKYWDERTREQDFIIQRIKDLESRQLEAQGITIEVENGK